MDQPIHIGQQLLKNRVIYLAGEVDTKQADFVVSSLLVLNALDKDKRINLYISSHGGGVDAGIAIYDCMQIIEAPVATYCLGLAYSMAAWLLAAGEKGSRYATLNSRIMIHQIRTGTSGTTTDIQIDAQMMLEQQDLMTTILSHHTGRPFDEIKRRVQHDVWFRPVEAIEFGIIDKILEPKKPVAGGRDTALKV